MNIVHITERTEYTCIYIYIFVLTLHDVRSQFGHEFLADRYTALQYILFELQEKLIPVTRFESTNVKNTKTNKISDVKRHFIRVSGKKGCREKSKRFRTGGFTFRDVSLLRDKLAFPVT